MLEESEEMGVAVLEANPIVSVAMLIFCKGISRNRASITIK
jgi:hypothetical protein